MKNKTILSVIGVVLSMALMVAIAVLADNKMIDSVCTVILMTVSALLVLLAVFYAAKVDCETGVYVCRKCGHTFRPTVKAYIWGMHTLRTRYLTCPHCDEKSWCIRKKDPTV